MYLHYPTLPKNTKIHGYMPGGVIEKPRQSELAILPIKASTPSITEGIQELPRYLTVCYTPLHTQQPLGLSHSLPSYDV